jgi:hypothetical protein
MKLEVKPFVTTLGEHFITIGVMDIDSMILESRNVQRKEVQFNVPLHLKTPRGVFIFKPIFTVWDPLTHDFDIDDFDVVYKTDGWYTI